MSQSFNMRDLLPAKAVAASLEAASKKDVLLQISEAAAKNIGADAQAVFDVLWERERLGTTGVGQGIAIPHGRVAGLDKVSGFFARLAQPVGFDAIDDKPVDLVFLLLAPESAGADHLHALATVSRLLRDAKLCEQIRRAKDAGAIYRLLTETAAVQAA
ncbi:MAG: PTS IIA-like nitrogen regulatory protein PtsN [Alphaproteobacteria bacterium]|nr:PTS IIA-like nitrogen regulatory protein PtsN [Alphaproteobacteria bacterium]